MPSAYRAGPGRTSAYLGRFFVGRVDLLKSPPQFFTCGTVSYSGGGNPAALILEECREALLHIIPLSGSSKRVYRVGNPH